MKNVSLPQFVKSFDFSFERNYLIEEILNDGFYYFTHGDFDFDQRDECLNFNDLYTKLIGDVIILRYDKKLCKLSLIPSVSSKGLYYYKNKKKFIVFSDENNAYLYLLKNKKFNLDTNEFISLLVSHQLCWNSPFGSLEMNIKYLPGGIEFIIYENLENEYRLKILDAYKSKKFLKGTKNFVKTLRAVIFSYFKIYKGEINLLFSGGIDSTLLWKIISKEFPKVECLNVTYPLPINIKLFQKSNIESEMVDNVSSKLGVKLKKINFSDNNSANFFKACQLSPRILISLAQLRLNSISLKKYNTYNENFKLILLSGQNADTIHSLNTYAPSTEMVFPMRQIYNLLSIYRRFKYNYFYVRLLNIFPKNNFLFKETTNIDSIKEHGIGKNHYLLDFDKNYKNYFFSNRRDLFDLRNYLNNNNKIFLNNIDKELFLRIFRHFRTIQNSLRIFGDYSKHSNYQLKKMPFCESPVYFFLLSYKRNLIDIFIPKKLIYRGFNYLSGFKYRKLMKKATFKNLLLTILSIYQLKKNKKINFDEYDYDTLLNFTKYTFKHYPLRDSKFKSILEASSLPKLLLFEIILNIKDLNKLIELDKNLAIKEIKEIESRISMKYILRLLNLFIYINSISN